MTGKTGRYFVAVPLPETVKNSLEHIHKTLVSDKTNYRWVRRNLLHLTVLFCGEQTEHNILVFADNLEERVGHMPAFNFTLGKVGAFPSFHKPKVIWIGIENGSDALQNLHQTIASTFGQCILPHDSDALIFHPHITLARTKRQSEIRNLHLIEAQASVITKEYIPVQHIKLVESKLSRDGPEYKCVKTFSLEG